jgi:hypothetical protein
MSVSRLKPIVGRQRPNLYAVLRPELRQPLEDSISRHPASSSTTVVPFETFCYNVWESSVLAVARAVGVLRE